MSAGIILDFDDTEEDEENDEVAELAPIVSTMFKTAATTPAHFNAGSFAPTSASSFQSHSQLGASAKSPKLVPLAQNAVDANVQISVTDLFAGASHYPNQYQNASKPPHKKMKVDDLFQMSSAPQALPTVRLQIHCSQLR